MLNNTFKLLFILFLILSTLITMSSFSWMSMWMGLEINLLSFLPLMISSKNLFSIEASLKYFLIQVLASSIFFFSLLLMFLLMNLKFKNLFMLNLIFMLSMFFKMGAAPFHFWLPSVIEGLKWMNVYVLITWQKLAPLTILSFNLNFYFLMFSIFMCAMLGSIGGLNQTSLRKLLAFSSINHLSWILLTLTFNEKYWIIYFIFYMFLNFSIIFMFKILNLYFLNQIFSTNLNFLIKIFLFINLLSLGGLPPFLGFFPKWIIIELMMINNMYLMILFLMFFSLITLFFYLRLCYSAFLLKNKMLNWNYKMKLFMKNYKFLFFFSFITITNLGLSNLFFMLI